MPASCIAIVVSTSVIAACLGDIVRQKSLGTAITCCPQEVEKIGFIYALGPHLAAQQPVLAAHGAAAAEQGAAEHLAPHLAAAALQPAAVFLAFLAFFAAEQGLHALREAGAHVAEAATGATAMVRPPATASIVARLIDFDM